MPETKKPFVLLQPELLHALYGRVQLFSEKTKIRSRHNEASWTAAMLASAVTVADEQDALVFPVNAPGAARLRGVSHKAKVGVGFSPEEWCVAVAGAASLAKLASAGTVLLAFAGPASVLENEGRLSFQFAAERRLPLIWITQTNLAGRAEVSVEGSRPRLPRVVTDAEDAVALLRVLTECVRQARTGGGATWLDAVTGAPDTTERGAKDPKRVRGQELSLNKMRDYLATRKLLPATRVKLPAKAIRILEL